MFFATFLLFTTTAFVLTWPCSWAHLLGVASKCSISVGQGKFAPEPVYTGYRSQELELTVIFPNNIFTLDTTERMQRKLVLRDSDGQPTIKIMRTAVPEHRNVKLGRENEVSELTRMNFSVTYIAPEKEQNWSNWYVLSGINRGTEFYFRRWYCNDSVVSIEFMYAKEFAPLFDNIIPKMTNELAMNGCD